MTLFEELKRRNVFRVGTTYAVATWLLMQVMDVLSATFDLPGWAPKLLFLILLAGFVPVVIFAWVFELTPEGIKRETEINRDASITHVTAKKLDYVTIVLLIAVLMVVAVDRMIPEAEKGSEPFSENPTADRSSGAEKGSDPVSISSPPPAKSIAVLPFVNMSEDANNEYFSDGISEELLNALAKVTDLKVAGRTSSFAFKGQNQDLRRIGAALNVSHILEGSVRKSGNRVRVTAQLIKVDDGYHVWSENYDRELDDIFAIQDEISAAILDQLKAHLIGGEAATVARTDSQAYDLYLLASQRIYERNEASLQMASNLLNEAIGIDPNYAPAYAQLGIATLLLTEDNYGSLPLTEAHPKAKDLLDRALKLDPNQAEAMAGLGLHAQDALLDYELSTEWLQKALAINPNLTNASVWLASLMSDQGNLQGGIDILRQSFARDPLHPPTYNNLAIDLSSAGRFGEARAVLQDVQRVLPDNAFMRAIQGKVEVMAGNWAEADRLLSQVIENEPLNFTDREWLSAATLGTRQFERVAEIGTPGFKALALDKLGRTEESLMLATEFADQGQDPTAVIEILVRNGRFQEAVDYVQSRWPSLDELEKVFPKREGYGSQLLNLLAQAYSGVGDKGGFDDAMSRAAASLKAQVDAGANNWLLHTSRAHHAMLAGDPEGAMELLNRAVAEGGLPQIDLVGDFSAFAPLRGDSGFEAMLDNVRSHINAERAELGLEPITN